MKPKWIDSHDADDYFEKLQEHPMMCDCCKQETDTLFTIKVLSLGDKDVCAKCYLRMLPDPDRTRKFL